MKAQDGVNSGIVCHCGVIGLICIHCQLCNSREGFGSKNLLSIALIEKNILW